MSLRILVTGSRDWPDQQMVWEALDRVLGVTGWPPGPVAGDVIIVHGACLTGADRHAAEWAADRHIPTEPHPADWQRLGKAAGPIRNQQMVDAAIDLCLAFPMPHSWGTKDCMARARAAGIPIVDHGIDIVSGETWEFRQ